MFAHLEDLHGQRALCMCNNGSGGNDDDKCSGLGGGCSDGDSKVEDDGDGGIGVSDSGNGGKVNSSGSGGDGKFASVTKKRL